MWLELDVQLCEMLVRSQVGVSEIGNKGCQLLPFHMKRFLQQTFAEKYIQYNCVERWAKEMITRQKEKARLLHIFTHFFSFIENSNSYFVLSMYYVPGALNT